MPANLWNDAEAPRGDGLASLVYRSRLLGADRSVANIYGGNTSVKSRERDHLYREVEVLWVKGSGSDLASVTEKNFAGLKLEEVLPLMDRSSMTDEEMVAHLQRSLFHPDSPRPSIETLLHAFVKAKHVDHTHPDAILSIASSVNGPDVAREIYGERALWVDYVRPGFALAKRIADAQRKNPDLECVIMAKHGLVTWGETSKECYGNTIRIISEAEAYLSHHRKSFAVRVPQLKDPERDRLLARVLPVIRGAMMDWGPLVLSVDTDPEVLAFVGSDPARELSQVGAACPDHLVHTKRVPLFLDWRPEQGDEALVEKARSGIRRFAEDYQAYFDAHRQPGDTMFPPVPRVILIPGIGLITAGPNAWAAEVSRQLYHRAIQVMRGAFGLGGFVSLSPEEAYAVEYWPLELYKLSLKPKPRPLEGRVALITGAASGIGRAIAYRFAAEGAHVVIADVNASGGEAVASDIRNKHGFRRALAVGVDVTDEVAVQAAFEQAVLAYGGVDIVVNNAGISSSAPIEKTTLELWNRNLGVLATGYFLVAREAFRLWKTQGQGGNLVFICSKNSVAASKNASAYSAAKAAELHLARCLAEEGGPHGIRVNSVLPDAVLAGSSIWSSAWRKERAATYGIREEELEEFYRQRTALKVNIYPEDVAEAAYFFASPASSKITGGVLTVDGGVATAYVR